MSGIGRDIEEARAQRDHWIRAFNRLEAAVVHHRREASQLMTTDWDDALYAAHDRILRDAAHGPTEEGQHGNPGSTRTDDAR